MSRSENQASPSRGRYFLMMLITAYLLFFSAVTNEITAFVALAILILFSAVLLRSRLLALAVGIPAALGFLSSASLIPVASVIAVIFIIGMGAVVLLHVNKPLVGVCFAAAIGLSLLFTKSILSSATVLLFVLCAILLAIALAKGMRRTSAICLVAAGLLLGYLAIFAIALYRLTGEITTDALSSLISQFHELFLEAFKESTKLLDKELRALFTEEAFNAAFDAVLCSLPAGFVLAASLPAFLAHLLSFMLCAESGYMERIPEESRPFVLSPVTAVLYIAALLLTFLAPYMGSGSDLILLTAQNMTLILMPPLLLVGALGIYGFLAQNRGCLNVWVLLGIVLLILYTRGILLYPISFIGVYLTFRVNRKRPFQE